MDEKTRCHWWHSRMVEGSGNIGKINLISWLRCKTPFSEPYSGINLRVAVMRRGFSAPPVPTWAGLSPLHLQLFLCVVLSPHQFINSSTHQRLWVLKNAQGQPQGHFQQDLREREKFEAQLNSFKCCTRLCGNKTANTIVLKEPGSIRQKRLLNEISAG